MAQDTRYSTIHVLMDSGHINSFKEIFDYIPKTIVYRDLRVNFNRFSKAVFNPSKLSIDELMKLAEMFDVDAKRIIDMAYEQTLSAKKKRKR